MGHKTTKEVRRTPANAYSFQLWPVLAAMLAIATLANPFSGPTYGVFLMACGAVTAGNIRQRLLLPADERSRDASQRTVAVT